MCYYLLTFVDRVSLCSCDWLGTCYVDEAGLKVVAIFLPLTLECWDYNGGSHAA